MGLASLTATMMRDGGAGERSPAELDERIEFLAAGISASSRDTEARASLRTITPVFEESLDLFFDVLMRPRFDAERFGVRQENVREDLKQRNDDADSLLGREWDFLLYGQDHYLGRRMTSGHLDAITPDDLRDFHRRTWRPEHMVWSVSGDVDTAEILAMLEERLAAWPAADDAAAVDWPPPHEVPNPAPGIYHVEKDIPQGKVRIGNLAPRWDDWDNPERAAIQVMDHILGASGFTSRIMQRVRSDEGLAYGAGGRFGFNPLGPSGYSMGYQSKSPTVALAAAIALEEVHRMRDEAVSPEELELARRSLVDSFPRRFESAQARAGIFANDAFLERDHGYWVRWREQIEAVTAEDVVAVAQKYLRPDQMVMLVVGIWEDIGPGDPGGPRQDGRHPERRGDAPPGARPAHAGSGPAPGPVGERSAGLRPASTAERRSKPHIAARAEAREWSAGLRPASTAERRSKNRELKRANRSPTGIDPERRSKPQALKPMERRSPTGIDRREAVETTHRCRS